MGLSPCSRGLPGQVNVKYHPMVYSSTLLCVELLVPWRASKAFCPAVLILEYTQTWKKLFMQYMTGSLWIVDMEDTTNWLGTAPQAVLFAHQPSRYLANHE